MLPKLGHPNHTHLIRILVCCAGVILVLASGYIPPSGINTGVLSFGVALMASAMLNLLESWLGADIPTLVEDKLAFNKNVHQLGLTAVYPNGGDTAIFLRFESAKSLDLMYNTGKMLTYAHQQKLRLALQRGCHIRVLMSDSGSEFWELENLTTGLCPGGDVRGELRDVERNLEGLISDLKNANPPLKGGSMEIRAYPCVPPCSLLIIDNESIRYTPYLPYMHSGEVPAFDIVRRGSPALLTNTNARTPVCGSDPAP